MGRSRERSRSRRRRSRERSRSRRRDRLPPTGLLAPKTEKGEEKKKKKKKKKKETSSSASSSSSDAEDWRKKVWATGFQGGAPGYPGYPGFPGMGMPYFGWPGMGYPNEGDGQAQEDDHDEGGQRRQKKKKTKDGWGRPIEVSDEPPPAETAAALDVPVFLEKAIEDVILVPKALIRKVIGKQAQTIIDIRQKSGVFKLDARDQSGDPVEVKVAGTADSVEKAKQLIAELLDSTKRVNDDADFVEIPKAKIGMVIGLKGSQINEIQSQTGTHIDVDFDQDPCKAYIKGPSEAVAQAKKVLLTITMQVEDQTSEYLDLPKGVSGVLLGAQGQKVRDLQENTGARIDVDKTGLNCRIRLSGAPEAIAKAKRAIYDETQGMMQPVGMQWQSAMPLNPNGPPMNALPEVKPMDFPMSIEESIARAKQAAAAVASRGDQPNLPPTMSGPVTTAGFSMEPLANSNSVPSDVDPYAMRMHAVPVPPGMVGKVIGQGGSIIRSLEAMSGCQLSFDHEKSCMMVTGIPDAIKTVEAEIQKLLANTWTHGASLQNPLMQGGMQGSMMSGMQSGMQGSMMTGMQSGMQGPMGTGLTGPGLPGLAHLRSSAPNTNFNPMPNMMGANMKGGFRGKGKW